MKILLLLLIGSFLCSAKPALNVIVIFTDDQGYNDLGCFGSQTIETPHIDQLAQEGKKFTSFYVASPVCSPSRAGLLTGCYPKRVGMHRGVLRPTSTYGLNPEEHTMADHFSSHGYATACIGKWHLGHLPEVLPTSNGFDSYYGIPYSNDMNHPENRDKPIGSGTTKGFDRLWRDSESTLTEWKAPLVENEKIIEHPVDQRTLTRRYTDKAIEFIETNHKRGKPFFLYLPHSMPHVPLFVPDEVKDEDPKLAYTNVIEHLDDQVGRLVTALRESGAAENTLVVFTSDNGPWLRFKHHAGSAFPLRGAKASCFEGGQRVPCIIWSPGRVEPGATSDHIFSTIDLLPTLASITETELCGEHKIDGLDASLSVVGNEDSPRNEFVYYSSKGLLAGIRVDSWKLILTGSGKEKTVLLFELKNDLSETTNLASRYPEVVARLKRRMEKIDGGIGGDARPVWGKLNLR